jgi:hypothetical protein
MQHEPYESNDSLEIIYVYTRAQAIEDGVLIDVSDTAREAGFKCPVALTNAAYTDCVEWLSWPNYATSRGGPPEGESPNDYQDEKGRLWDVLNMCRFYAQRTTQPMMYFPVCRVPRGGGKARDTRLKSMIGPGDNGEMVITIMLPLED